MRYLLEIGVEELPPSMMKNIFSQLKKLTNSFIEKNEIICGDSTFGMTPRRLVVFIGDIEIKTKEKVVVLKGPPKKICFNENDEIQKPLEAFLKKNNIKIEQVEFIEESKGTYAYAKKEISGKPVELILGRLGPFLYENFNFAKKMRWGNGEFQFVRPIRWVLSLLGNKKLDIKIGGIKSADHTFSSGQYRSKSIKIDGVQDYFDIMEKEGIILSPSKRVAKVKEQLDAIAENIKATYDPDSDLLEEISCLVEIPSPIKGSFDSKYLSLPSEVLIQTMKKNQKFIVFKQNHKVINTFVGFFNGNINPDTEANVKRGYQRVLIARLADANYFYENDLKKDFDSLYQQLSGVLYHHKLSTMKRKMDNVSEIALFLNDVLALEIEKNNITCAAKYCKADLLTEMVNEFADLQGIMGKIYVSKKYSLPDVSTSVFEHYLPRFKNDRLPENSLGALLAISDKIETLFGAIVASIKFSGSKDPYGIRRTANGLIDVIISRKMDFDLNCITSRLAEIFKDLIEKNKKSADQVCEEFKSLLLQRSKQYFTERGFKYDFVDSVLMENNINFHEWSVKLKALGEVAEKIDVSTIVIPAVRINNILKEFSCQAEINTDLFENEKEIELYDFYKENCDRIKNSLEIKDFVDCISCVISFGPILDSFFDNVHVNADNPDIKENRLRLLYYIKEIFYQVLDFSKLVKDGQ